MTQILGADVSSYQPGQLNLAGLSFIISKATQGTGYVNPNHAAQIAEARALAIGVGHYHFADGGDAVSEARFFVANSGWKSGEIVALDVEKPFVDTCADPVAWAGTFAAEVRRLTGVEEDTYLNYSDRHAHDWRPLAARGGGLWDAEYNSVGPTDSAPWPFVSLWQNSDTNQTGGDSDVFLGDLGAFRKYGTPAGSAPAPAPHVPAAAVTPHPAAPAPKKCTVVSGDTMSGIALQVGVSLAALEAVNPGINYNLIQPGQILNLPANANLAKLTGSPRPPAAPAPAAGPAECRVTAGDTLSGIGIQFGRPWQTIAALNGLRAPYTIYKDEVLRLR
jgi:LysM repeat protein